MIKPELYRNRNVAVVGYGKTGQSVIDALECVDANIFLLDDRNLDHKYFCDFRKLDWRNIDCMVVSPGISLLWNASEIVLCAYKFSIPVISDIDVFQQSVNSKIVAITGTNGKSTTTALIHHLLNGSCGAADIGGNFGLPVLSLRENADFYVLELSSYQLEACNVLGFDFSVLLNITSDHLTRHGGMNGYIAMKQKVFAHAENNSIAVIGVDDEYCRHLLDCVHHKNVIQISGKEVPANGIGWRDDQLIDNRNGNNKIICDRSPILDGVHNRQNIAAAYAVCSSAGLSDEEFSRKLFSFGGLEHRQEFVKNINGVTYINDSKATNADSVEQALMRFDDVIWILGGRAKEDGIEKLVTYFPKIRHAFLIGEIAEEWHALFDKYNVKNEISETLENAVDSAYRIATSGNVVLLSPACASFDQFKSFEERGDRFKKLVGDLPC